MSARQDSDNLAWDLSDERFDKAVQHVQLSSTCRKMASLAERILGKPATFVPPLVVGGFNVLYPIRIEGLSQTVLIRVPCPDQAIFPEEKTYVEGATALCLAERTGIPMPKLFDFGVDPELGPFLIIEDLVSRRGMGRALEAPRKSDDTPILRSDIAESTLRCLYGRLARCLFSLAQVSFPRIGSLVKTRTGYEVEERPFTLNMSNMVQLGNIPTSIFPSKGTTYQTDDQWYTALAEMHIATLVFQHNDIIASENDCKTKYVARQLFRRLAKQGHLSKFGFAEDSWSAGSKCHRGTLSPPDGSGSFRLWHDDFRPANVLIDESDEILGVIDWEFAYVGPSQFALDPPWWLLLDAPELWDDGIDSWTSIYQTRLPTWLSAMEDIEAESNPGPDALLLSAYMRESWATGRFWLNYAARKSWAFDAIYWKYLDERFFGEREEKSMPADELWKTRVHLLSEDERAGMESMVQIKMEEAQNRVLVEWDAEEARQRLALFLF